MDEQKIDEIQELSLEEAAEVKGGGFWSWLFGGSKGKNYAAGRAAYSSSRLA